MAFDLGFNYRSTAGYVTDPSYGVPVLSETYPHTYTAANGYSINAGWATAPSTADRSNTNDPRIAGINYHGSTDLDFTVDLSSGSAPGAGTYTVDIAMGDAGSSNDDSYLLLDTSTTLIDATNGGAGIGGIGAGSFYDATVSIVTASTTWTGATVSKTFATTTAILRLKPIISTNTVAHFRLTLAASGTAYTLAVDPMTLHLNAQDVGLTVTAPQAYTLAVDPLTLQINPGDVGLAVTPASQGIGGSLLLLGLQFTRPATGGGIAYSLAVDPLTLHLNLDDVGLQVSGPTSYSLAVDPLVLHVNLADVGLTLTAPFQYSLAVDPLVIHLNGGDVGLAYSPFTPPRALPSTSGRSPYLEYRRHRRMGR